MDVPGTFDHSRDAAPPGITGAWRPALKIALLTDIHGNREALEACLADARRIGIDRLVFLGDLVGYGPDPQWVVDKVASEIAKGAICVKGNHDAAVQARDDDMTEHAARAMSWTRSALDSTAIRFLRELPMEIREDDIHYVHASARNPERWAYILDRVAAGACLQASEARLIFVGHTHQPAMFHQLPGKGAAEIFRPATNKAVPLTARRRWAIVVGSVGQPRDQNPSAGWGLLDTEAETYTQRRVPYDIERTGQKIIAAGLPAWLAQRLTLGR